jgi:hypothetical protein
MANISVSVTDGNNIAVEVTPVPTQVITIDRGIAGPVGPPGPAGSVASVALTAPALFSVSGSPITSTGTLALTYSGSALPVANGGTGLTSYASNGVLYASGAGTLANGSALVFDGTKLGIGTTSPAAGYKTTIAGSSAWITAGANFTIEPDASTGANGVNLITSFSAGGNGPLNLWTGGSERMRLDASGNLGLGVTPSAWASNYRAIQQAQGGGALVTLTDSVQTHLASNWYYDGSDKYYTGGTASRYTQVSGQHRWLTAPSGTAGNAISFTQAMTLDASGDISIGTTAGGVRLQAFTATDNVEYFRAGTSVESRGIRFSSFAVGGGNGVGHLINAPGASGANGTLAFATNSTERMRLDASGNLNVANLTASKPVFTDASKNLTSTGTVPVANGGTGLSTIAALSIPVANTLNTYTTVTPTAGQSIRINAGATAWEAYTPGSGGTGTVTSVSVVSANGFAGTVATATTTPAITLSTSITGVLKGNGTAISAATAGTDYVAPGTATTFTAAQSFTASGILLKGSSTGYTTFTSANASATNYTVTVPAETMTVGYKNIPAVGTKTASYTLAVADVGKYVQVSTGGSITIPTATFAEGDIVSVFNNTAAAITITCTITTAYIAGTDADRATVSLATRGVATILFISGTICVISGNVS